MSLNIIYGRSGTGKSEYIYKDISDKIGKERIFLIVPEQSNLSAEKKLFEISGKDSLIDVEVLTLSRMAHRVNSALLENRPVLSKVAKNMIIYDLLSENKTKLNFLGKTDKNIETVERLFTEFKKHNITTQKMQSLSTDDNYLNLKINDARLLFEAYCEKIKNVYVDENDELSMLAQNIDKTNLFNDACIFIDEFLGFTPQEYEVFEKLIEKAKSISVAISLDSLESKSSANDIFYFNRIFANKLKDIAESKNIEVKSIFLEENNKYKNPELVFLEKNLYKYSSKYKDDVKNISMFLANNPYSELEYVAEKIYGLVESGYRYKDIGIVSEDMEKYSEDAKAIFRKFGIPLFIDEKKSLNQNVLIRFVIALIEILSSNWTYESVINYIKIGLLDIKEEDVYTFENYCIKWGIKRSKWYSRKFDYEEANDVQEHIEELREKIVNPIIEFKNTVSKSKTAGEITKGIYDFIVKNNICDTLNTKLKKYNNIELSSEYNTSYGLFVSVLEEINLLFGEEKMTFDKYRDLLKVALDSCELGTIPATQDQVVFGDTERTRSGKIKILFVVGVNDGCFPKVNMSEGFFNDEDRKKLRESNIELAKDSIESIYEEQFNIYRTLLTPEEGLVITYSSSDKQGKSIRPSILVKKINMIFDSKIPIESDIVEKKYVITNYQDTFEKSLELYKDYVDGKVITDEWKKVVAYYYEKENKKFTNLTKGMNYTNRAEKISKEQIQRLYGDRLETTISRLESYRRCPFSFHITYGLKLKERQDLNIETVDTGSFMHEVIDLFFKEIDTRNLKIKEIDNDITFEIVTSVINSLLETSRYYKFTSTAKFRLLTRRLKKIVYDTICYIVYSLKYSDFSVLGHEVEFSNSGKYKKLELDVEDKKVCITGKIDRVDVGINGENQYVRIIDYKSSKKKIDMNQVESGLQIQLITYLDAICDKTGCEPSGVFYLGMINDAVKNSKTMTREEIENSIRKKFRMNGFVLADINVIRMMDKKISNGEKSDIIPISITKSGEIGKQEGAAISKEDFAKLRNGVKEVIKQISKEILNGIIDIKPYYYSNKTGCDYCKYKPICMFNTSIKGNEYNVIKSGG